MVNARAIYIIIMACVVAATWAKAQVNHASDFYDRWVIMPTNELMDRGRACLAEPVKPDSAVLWYTIAANRYNDESRPKSERERAVGAMNNLGYIYFFFYQDYYKAHSFFKKALKLSLDNGYDSNLSYLYLNFGNLYAVNEDAARSELLQKYELEYYRKAFAEAVRNKQYDIVCIAATNMIDAAYASKQMKLVEKEMATFRSLRLPDSTVLGGYARQMVRIFDLLASKNYAEALRECDVAVGLVDAKETPERYITSALGLKAHTLSLMGDNHRAFAVLEEIERLARMHHMTDVMVNVLREYSMLYKDFGDESQYRNYRMKYLELKDSIDSATRLKNVNEMQFLYEISSLNDRMAEAERQKAEQSMTLKIVAGVSVVVLLTLIVLCVAYRKQRQANRHLYQKSLDALRSMEEERSLRRQLQERIDAAAEAEAKKAAGTSRQSIDEAEGYMIVRQIERAMEDVEVISNPDFSLKRLAELINEKYWTVSKVINERCGKNFNTLLGEYRVNEACRRFNDTAHYGQFTIEGISKSIGFRSRSNFVTVFKSVTGLTPSEYQRMAREKNK